MIGHSGKGRRRSMAWLCLRTLGGRSQGDVGRLVGGVGGRHQEAIGIRHGRLWQCMLGRGAA